MKTARIVALSMLSGVVLGASVIQALHAQAKPPVYAIVDIDEITDATGYVANSGRSNESAAAPFEDVSARVLVRTDKITALDGTPPVRVIVAVFESMEKARAWYNSPDQKKVNDIRMKTTKSRLFLAEGL